jgi:hypothetical protein
MYMECSFKEYSAFGGVFWRSPVQDNALYFEDEDSKFPLEPKYIFTATFYVVIQCILS